MTHQTDKDEILDSLEPLFKEAEEEGLWFFSTYQRLWFSPEELREAHEEGRFIWGPDNWELRDPQERLEELERKKQNAEEELKQFREKVGAP